MRFSSLLLPLFLGAACAQNDSTPSNFKHPTLCDPTVVQHSGYIEVDNDVHYFFWFFESRGDPINDPLTVWLNGGPGCSSMIGLWDELGPCHVNADGTEAIYNEASWNKVSNMLFFDQPAGVGFSYGKNNVNTTSAAAPLAYKLIQEFLKAFPVYQANDFFFYGESYGGHYIPEFADYILKQNTNLAPGAVHVNLKSIGIGNGLTDPLIQYQYYQPMACHSNYGPVLNASDCQSMLDHTPQCVHLMKQCYKTGTLEDCLKGNNYCIDHVAGVYANANRSISDVRTSKEIPSTFVKYLTLPSTMETIGARVNFTECAVQAGQNFLDTADDARDFSGKVANLLNHGIKVLLYAGDADYLCNWMGNYAWSNQFNFKGADDYRGKKLTAWKVEGKEVGEFKQGGNLTFVRVYNAGHHMAHYQPNVALQMFTNQVQGLSYA
ncbi:carboxypeptidase S1 [Gongronella butleri]|nr:carboxypeptidase S1 [Gongronella butleri]